MALLQCEMCCGELEISSDRSIGICKYCGSTFTIPKEIEKKGNLFNRANYLRQNCNFDKAISVYESILADNCEDADALWGLVLCRYGIEFVEDPKTKSRIPTCHRASRTSILLDPDFKSALRYADEEKRGVYYENASRIDQIQKAILSMSDSQEKYDVFICYKETDDYGERTVDSVLAQELYNELGKMKIKTFFARKTLEGMMGSSYEPIIYSALNSAKVMIVLGTKPEYFEATWVKNEWSRYLDFMKDSDDKHLIPAYRGMSAYQLPVEFASIQALDMARIGFMLDLCDGVKKLLRKEESNDDMSAAPISKESLYSRAMVFLGNREFYKAVDYFEKVLDIEPKYARAYWGSLLASYQCVTANELINCTSDDWTEDARLQNALQFASDEERMIYQDTLDRRIHNFKKLANVALENRDFEKCQSWCSKYIDKDATNGSVWWIRLLAANQACNSNELYENCLHSLVSPIDTEDYMNALKYSIPEESQMFEKTVMKIDAAVMEKSRIRAYDSCKIYMENSINAFQRSKKSHMSSRMKDYDAESQAIRNLINSRAHFYRNNFFSFLLNIFKWAVPMYVFTWIFVLESEITKSPYMIFLIELLIMVGIMSLVKFVKYINASKEIKFLLKRCEFVQNSLKKGEDEIKFDEECEKCARDLYEKFMAIENPTMEEIDERRREFQAVYEGLKQKG